MKRDYKYEELDKAMSKRIDEIYSDPARHAFVSCSSMAEANPELFRGRHGGKLYAKKLKCFYCGKKKHEHAAVTEDL